MADEHKKKDPADVAFLTCLPDTINPPGPRPVEEATRRQRPWTTFSLPTTGGARCVSWYASRAPSSRRLRSSRRRRRTFRLVFEHPPAMCVTPFLVAV